MLQHLGPDPGFHGGRAQGMQPPLGARPRPTPPRPSRAASRQECTPAGSGGMGRTPDVSGNPGSVGYRAARRPCWLHPKPRSHWKRSGQGQPGSPILWPQQHRTPPHGYCRKRCHLWGCPLFNRACPSIRHGCTHVIGKIRGFRAPGRGQTGEVRVKGLPGDRGGVGNRKVRHGQSGFIFGNGLFQ
jgi:hypothetical protein